MPAKSIFRLLLALLIAPMGALFVTYAVIFWNISPNSLNELSFNKILRVFSYDEELLVLKIPIIFCYLFSWMISLPSIFILRIFAKSKYIHYAFIRVFSVPFITMIAIFYYAFAEPSSSQFRSDDIGMMLLLLIFFGLCGFLTSSLWWLIARPDQRLVKKVGRYG